MREYKLSPAFFSRMRRRILLASPLTLLAAGVGLWIGSRGNLSISLLIAVPLVLVVVIFGLIKGLHQQQRFWSSYRVILEERSIRRVQDGLQDITIKNEEISKIIEASQLGLDVCATASRRIGIPGTLEGYSEVRQELANRHSIDIAPKAIAKWMPLLPVASGLLSLLLFAISFLSTNRYIVISAGSLLFVGMLTSLISIQLNIHVTKQVRRNSWLVIIVLLPLAIRIFSMVADSR